MYTQKGFRPETGSQNYIPSGRAKLTWHGDFFQCKYSQIKDLCNLFLSMDLSSTHFADRKCAALKTKIKQNFNGFQQAKTLSVFVPCQVEKWKHEFFFIN